MYKSDALKDYIKLIDKSIIVNSINKKLVPNSNLDEFIACLDYFLEQEDIAIQMGENGYEYVIENFSYHKIAEKYLDFLNGLEL